MDLSRGGKAAMITGGTRGLGLQIASVLAREGCRISICGRDGRQARDRPNLPVEGEGT